MKNVLMKFAGLFVERVPVDESGNPLPPGPRQVSQQQPPAQHAAPMPHQQAPPAAPQQPGAGQAPHLQPTAAAPAGAQPLQGAPIQAPSGPSGSPFPTAPPGAVPGTPAQAPPASVALRAWVPQEYAAQLAPHGIHVIAAGGSVTSEQARGWGADVLIISAECLGQDVHLLQQPQLPTVFITPQPVMIPDTPGVVQVQEPLRASDVARAVREAAAAFAAARS